MEADEPALGQVPGDHYPAHRAAGAGDGWTKHTIITMLSRLEKKGAVAHRENGRAKEFWPVLDQADALPPGDPEFSGPALWREPWG